MRLVSYSSPLLLVPLAAFLVATTAQRNASAQDEPPLPPLPAETEDTGKPASAEGKVNASASTSSSTSSTSTAAQSGTSGPTPRVVEPRPKANGAAGPGPIETTTVPNPYGDEWLPEHAPDTAATAEKKYREWSRKQSAWNTTTLYGGIGLFRVQNASGGEAGQFRFGLTGSFFSGSNFLCSELAPCADPVTGIAVATDSSQRIEANANISATPFSFLEVYLALRNTATQNDRGRPNLLQILGDSMLGVKAFTPVEADRIFYFGGAAELLLLTGMGGVGLSGGATGFALRGLATLDLNNRLKEADRIPLRFHGNMSYVFDNSAAVVSNLEATPPPEGRGEPIARTERYGLNISRVDAFQIGIGGEYMNDWIRPFLEWTIDIPVNRQGYVCNVDSAAGRGDWCLGAQAGFATTPSRLSFGARGYPWQESGLALTLGLDIGTGGTKSFLEETRPETPYTLWFGLAYGVDTVPPAPEVIRVEAPAPTREVRRYIVGRVVDGAKNPIPDALVRFTEEGYTGLIADKNGYFITTDLAPGTYAFSVYAAEFKQGTCSAVVPETLSPPAIAPVASNTALTTDPLGEGPAPAPAQSKPEESERPEINEDGDYEIPLRCELKELPKVANIVGLVVDAKTGAPIPDARVTIQDKLGRTLAIAADAQGSLLFKNVVFGSAQLVVTAPGYLPASATLVIDSRKEVTVHLTMTSRPAKSGITTGARQLKLASRIDFVGETKEIAPESKAIVEELAAFLTENTTPAKVEIAVHADDSGAASYSRRLTQDRADMLRDTLVRLGVDGDRITARGYGPDEPLTGNVSDAARAKNRRVEIRITK